MPAFLIVVIVLWFVLHALTSLWLVERPASTSRTRRLVYAFTLATLSVITLVVDRLFTANVTLVYRWIGWTYIGGFSTLFVLLLLRKLALWGAARVRRIRANTEANTLASAERRSFLVRAGSSTTASFGVAAALTGYGVREARKLPEVVAVEVPIRGLPKAFDGYHIVQISDVHVGITIDKDTILPIIETVTSLGADLVVLTGDLVDGSVADLHDDVSPFGYLRAPDGVLCVTGNHEYYSGAEAWLAHFKKLGMRPLNNEHLVLRRADASLVIAGVTDYSAGRHLASHRSDPAGAVRDAPPNTVRILLAHQPRSAFEASKAGYALQLSGHTHGGQFFPWNLVVGLVQPVSRGLAKIDGMWVYVNRGTCWWGPPVRTGVPAEITSLRLRAV